MADEQNLNQPPPEISTPSVEISEPVVTPQPEMTPPPPAPPTDAPGESILSIKPNQKEIIFGILVVLVVIGGIYAFSKFATPAFLEKLSFIPATTPTPIATATPTPDLLAGWQTYSSKHGFSVKYPENWRLEAFLEQQDEIGTAQSAGTNYFQIYSYPSENSYNPSEPVPSNELKIEVWIKEENYQTIEEFIISAESYGIMGTNELTVNGERAVKILRNSDLGPVLSAYYVSDGKSVEFVSYPYDSAYSNEFDRIVQTFQFTGQPAQQDTSTWQTYRDEEFGFELKYPEGWTVNERGDISGHLIYLESSGSTISIFPEGGLDRGLGSPISQENMVIDSKNALRSIYGGNLIIISIENWLDNNRIEISAASKQAIADQILSTFKFIE